MDRQTPDEAQLPGCCCVAEGGNGCCCIGKGGEGCCCIGAGAKGWCCVLPGCIGLCCCCAAPMPTRSDKAAYAFPMRQATDPRIRQVPPELMELGVEQEQWTRWLDVIDSALRAHDAFYERPLFECCFHCCPCGPLQMCYCMANPWLHSQHREAAEARAWAANMINRDLRATSSARVVFEAPPSSPFGVLYDARAALKRPICVLPTNVGMQPLQDPELPAELAQLGATHEQWRRWVRTIDDARRAYLCHACPALGAAYLCVPFGPLQCCLCTLANPLSWWHSHRVRSARKASARAINAELQPLGAHLHFASHAGEFRRGMPKARKRPSKLSATIEIVAASTGGSFAASAIGGLTARAMDDEVDSPEPGKVRV